MQFCNIIFVVISAEAIGAVNTGFDTVCLHRPTLRLHLIARHLLRATPHRRVNAHKHLTEIRAQPTLGVNANKNRASQKACRFNEGRVIVHTAGRVVGCH